MNTIRQTSTGAILLLLAAAAPALASSPQGRGELKLLPDDGAVLDRFGLSVSLSEGLALVGASRAGSTGAAYLFDATTGVQLRKLTPLPGTGVLRFGCSVSLAGNLALVGANGDNENGPDTGAAYLFDVSTGGQLHRLIALDGVRHDYFGSSVSLSGGLALVGAWGTREDGVNSGSAYVFDVATGQQLHKLRPPDGAAHDGFGGSVSLSGGRALIAADGDDDSGYAAGSAYVFDAQTGQLLLKLSPPGVGYADRFGCSVALDGGLALVGALGDEVGGVRTGAAHLLDATTWQPIRRLAALDGELMDRFGCSVSLSGNLALVGAYFDDDNGVYSGSAYLFDVTTGQQLRKLMPHDGAAVDWFGTCGSVSEGLALVGSFKDDDNGDESGSAYVWDEAGAGLGIPYCFGDPGSGIPCPCSNDNDGSLPGAGCANGVFASGARLAGNGLASISDDTLTLVTIHLEPNQAGLYFQADSRLNGGDGIQFGDGLRCAGFGVIRLQIRLANATGVSNTTIAVGTTGGVIAGETKRYQCWYRTTVNPPCGIGVNDFNLSNGYELTWLP